MPLPRYPIEFVGGPYDGHRQFFVVRLKHVVLPVDEQMQRFLEENEPDAWSSTSQLVAVYELRRAAQGWRYHFVRVRPSDGT